MQGARAGAGAAQVWQAPTLIRVRTMQLGGDPEYAEDPDLRFVPAEMRAKFRFLEKEEAPATPGKPGEKPAPPKPPPVEPRQELKFDH